MMFEDGRIRPQLWSVQVGLDGAKAPDYGTGHQETMVVKTLPKNANDRYRSIFNMLEM